MDRKSELMSPLTRAVKPAAGESRVSARPTTGAMRKKPQRRFASSRNPFRQTRVYNANALRVSGTPVSTYLRSVAATTCHLNRRFPPDNSPGANDGRSSVRLKLLRSRTRGALAAWGLAAPGGAVRFLEA